jgi:hypothetical protein
MKMQALFAVMVASLISFMPYAQSAQLNFTPVVSVSEEYTDNLFLAPSGFKEDDWITTTTVGGTLEWLGRTAGLELTYLPSYEWYNDYSDFNGWNQDLAARTWYNFTANTSIELRNAYIRTRGSLEGSDYVAATSDDPLVAPEIAPDPNRRGLDEYYTNVTTARLDHRFGAEDTVYAQYSYRVRRDLDAPRDERSNNDIWEPSVGGTYWFTNFWGIETDILYSNRNYKNEEDRQQWDGRLRLNRRITRHLSIYGQYQQTYLDYEDDIGDDYDVYVPTVGISYQLDENTRIDIAPGWYFQELDRGGSDNGFIVEAAADKVWPFRTGLVGVTLLSGYDIDDQGVEDLGFQTYYEGAVRGEYAFSRRFTGTARVGYRWADYPDRNPSRTDKTITAGAGLQYQALRWMFLNLDYAFRDRKSDEEFNEYTENRVIFSITLTPEQPFRLLR